MTRDDIMRMAREAGISDTNFDFQMVSPEELERFAALVAAAEREACREVLEECIRTQAHLACNAREALSEASARIYKRGDA